MPEFQVKRCFLALPLDEVAVADLLELMEELQMPELRLSRPENLHVTLKFLGDVDDPDLPGIIELLGEVAGEVRPFDLLLRGVEYLPGEHRPRVLAAMLSEPAELRMLYERVEEAMSTAGFRRDGRAYHPHITLGRFRNPPQHAQPLTDHQPAETNFPIDRFTLMQSDLHRTGPQYTELASFDLTPHTS